MHNHQEDKKEDKTSAEASIKTGRQAIDMAKKRRRKKMKRKNQNKKKMQSNGEMKVDVYYMHEACCVEYSCGYTSSAYIMQYGYYLNINFLLCQPLIHLKHCLSTN